MALKLTNNGTSTLDGSITDVATTLSVQGADAGKFPTLSGGDWHPLTLTDASGNIEVVKVTARASAVLTIVRGQEGTTARAWTSGDRVDLRLTAGAMAALETPDAIHGATAKTTMVAADEVSIWDSAATAFKKITFTNLYTAIALGFAGLTAKTTLVAADTLHLNDSAASNAGKKITFTNLYTAIALGFASLTAKTSLVDADTLPLNDSAATNAGKKITWANVKAQIFAAWGALIAAGTSKATPVDADKIAIADSAATNATKQVTLTILWTAYLKAKADALYAGIANSISGLAIVAGDIVYGSGAATMARLAKGADGQVLTLASGLPSWASPAGGGLTLIGTMTTTSGSTQAITNIPSGYKHLLLVWKDVSRNYGGGSAAVAFKAAVSSDNGSTYGADIACSGKSTSTQKSSGRVDIFRAGETGVGKVIVGTLATDTALSTDSATGGGYDYSTTGVVDAVRITALGTFDSGEVHLYAVN